MSSSKRPRILFAANLHPEQNLMMQRYDSILAALDGYDLAFMDIFDFYGDHDRAMEAEAMCFDAQRLYDFFDRADIVELNRAFLKRVLSFEWDILCLCTISHFSQFLLPDTVRRLVGADKLVVAFFGDDETMMSHNKFWVGLFDAVVAYSEREVQQYQEWNAYTYLLPIGLGRLPAIPNPQEKDKAQGAKAQGAAEGPDVVFVGRPYGARPDMIRAVRNAGIDVQVFGSSSWHDYPDLRDVYKGFLEKDAFWRELSRAKVVLNLMEDLTGKPHINAKVFEAAMAGSFSLVTHYDPFETTYGLKDGYSIAFYRDSKDMVAQLRYYLAHGEHRERIARNLRQHLLDHFSYEKLYRTLFGQLEAQWRKCQSESVLRDGPSPDHATVVQFVDNLSDYRAAQETWSSYNDPHVIYVSRGSFRDPEVCLFRELRRRLDTGLARTMRDYVLVATPRTVYDAAVFGLVSRYGVVGFFEDGAYCNSIVQGRRLRKSTHFVDVGSSIWRRDAFLKHGLAALRWYQLVGGLIPRRLAPFRLTWMPLWLNVVSDRRGARLYRRYRRVLELLRGLKHR